MSDAAAIIAGCDETYDCEAERHSSRCWMGYAIEHADDCASCDASVSECSPTDACCDDCGHSANWPRVERDGAVQP